jgi:hypothetical protein
MLTKHKNAICKPDVLDSPHWMFSVFRLGHDRRVLIIKVSQGLDELFECDCHVSFSFLV